MQKKSTYLLVPSLIAISQLALASQPGVPTTPIRVMVNETALAINNLSEKELQKLFDVKNSKGESIRHTETPPQNEAGLWATSDSKLDGVEGTSTDKAYQSFRVPAQGKPIIVAVIDSGVDITHVDLKGKIWSNPSCKGGEVKVIDDGDGFKDDCHGWNFLGGHDAHGNNMNVGPTTLEVTREYVRLKKLHDAGTISAEDTDLFAKISADFTEQRDEKQALYERYQGFDAAYKLLYANGLTAETANAVNAVTSTDPTVTAAKALVLKLLDRKVDTAYVAMALGELGDAVKYQFNMDYDPYSANSPQSIVHDHPEVLDEKGYGNNDVTGPDASHGTHVSGIIAANRYNHIGVLGQARNVVIMPVRAVPNGDERDKDIGNAIYFAVNHGASIETCFSKTNTRCPGHDYS